MTTAVVAHEGSALAEKVEWAKTLSVATLLPKAYQKNPGNILYAAEYADSLGIHRINAITSIHVIEGKPSASADLIAGLVRRAGHKLRVTGDATTATAHLVRADDPDFIYEAVWNMEKARAAGLTGKAVWKNYPAAMLRARAITEVARMGASEALLGLIYTPEELGVDVDQTGAPVRVSVAAVASMDGADRMRAMLAPEPVEGEVADDELTPIGDAPEVITAAQQTKLHVLFGECDLGDRDAGLAWLTDELERPVTSSKSLTKAEASKAIESLTRLKALNDMPEPDVTA